MSWEVRRRALAAYLLLAGRPVADSRLLWLSVH